METAEVHSLRRKRSVQACKWFLTAMVICFVTAVLFCVKKTGMFIDEIYSYGLANGYYTPFLKDVLGGNAVEKVLTREMIFDYLTVGEEGLDLVSVYYNQTQDVHPPLFYWLLHLVSRLTPGRFTKWTGLALNLVIYCATLCLLYKISRKLMGSDVIGAAVVLFYGLSRGGLSTMLMIRMYALLTLLTVLMVYWLIRLMETDQPIYIAAVSITIFLGLMTQYYFVFYAFFLCAGYVIRCLFLRKPVKALQFSVAALSGVVMFVLVYPACIDHLLSDRLVSGTSAVENLSTLSMYAERLRCFDGYVKEGMPVCLAGVALGMAVFLVRFRRLMEQLEKESCFLQRVLLILMTGLPAFLIAALAAPVEADRYIYNLYPLVALGAGCVLYLMKSVWMSKTGSNTNLILFASLAASLLTGNA